VHEYSIVQSLLEAVEAHARRHGATAVHRLQVRIGELSGVESELLASAYEMFREKTMCEDAPLVIHRVEASFECPQCRGKVPRGAVLTCAACDVPARLVRGDEILLERIEMEVPDV
jgi:hydrogenase nickel incorporation protein HypA/HybF